jgi:hypothetical protein
MGVSGLLPWQGKPARKAKVKDEKTINRDIKVAGPKFVEFGLPVVKAAAKACYLARKKIECLKNSKKFFICRPGDRPAPGCLPN